jgi:hypothetical protein
MISLNPCDLLYMSVKVCARIDERAFVYFLCFSKKGSQSPSDLYVAIVQVIFMLQ